VTKKDQGIKSRTIQSECNRKHGFSSPSNAYSRYLQTSNISNDRCSEIVLFGIVSSKVNRQRNVVVGLGLFSRGDPDFDLVVPESRTQLQ
jgi:hypothetical protein